MDTYADYDYDYAYDYEKFTSLMLEWNKIRAIQQLDAIQTHENFV